MVNVARSAKGSFPQAKGYEVVRVLGERPIRSHLAYAVKGRSRRNAVVVERFARDASIPTEDILSLNRTAGALLASQPAHIVPIRDVIIDAEGLLVVSDFVDGLSLCELWEEEGLHLPLPMALRVLLDVLTGMEALHTLTDRGGQPLQLLHGEITPDNILVGNDGRVSLAHALRVSWVAPQVQGALLYLAPEVLRGRPSADLRADIYAAGAVLYRVMTGHAPFEGADAAGVLASMEQAPMAPARAPADMPWAAKLTDVVTRAMAIAPEKRFASARQMRDAIEKVTVGRVASPAELATWVAPVAKRRDRAREEPPAPPAVPMPTPEPTPKPATVAADEPVAVTPPAAPVPSAEPSAPTPGVDFSLDEAEAMQRASQRRRRVIVYVVAGVAVILILLLLIVALAPTG